MDALIPRERHLSRLEWLFQTFPAIAILGPRQIGKTTLARQFAERFEGRVSTFDLENPADLAQLEDPLLRLERVVGLIVLDEIQRKPEIFTALRVLIDQPDRDRRFLLLGSAAPDLLRQSSETLAGRINYYRVRGFSFDELPASQREQLWLRGAFPRSFLADDEASSFEWRRSFVQTFLERDLPQLGSRVPATTLHRFWTMLAHYHGQIWNGAELARAFGISQSSVRRYLDLLTDALVVRQLPPWHANISKRQVKSPKVYLEDSGIVHALLGLDSRDALLGHPKVGASWEGHLLNEIIERLAPRPEECYFWATHGGAELDLLVTRGKLRLGFEIKRTSAPKVTQSMKVAVEDLSLTRLNVLHAGTESFPMTDTIRAVSVNHLLEEIEPLDK